METGSRVPTHRVRLIGGLLVAGALTVSLAACAGNASGADAAGESAAEVNEELRGQLPDRIIDAGAVIIGGTYDNPPVLYASKEDATKPAGVAADLSAAIGELLGITPDWRNTQWSGQLPGIDSGALDIAWGQASVTAQREKELYDMIPFYAAPLAILVPDGNPMGITSFETMCGAKIGGSVGSVQEYYVGLANEQFCTPSGKPEIEFLSFTQAEEVALKSGTIDGVIDSFPVLNGAAKELDEVEAVKLSDASEFDSGLAGIVFSKDEPELSTAFAAALQELHANGTYQKILEDNGVPDAILDADQLVVNFLTGTPAGEIGK